MMKPFLICFLLSGLPLLFAADSASGLDTASIDPSVDPCVDFYQYACGNWMARHPLPADRARWGRFAELSDRNEKVLLDILQRAAVVRPGRPALEQKIGDFFASCMDTATINRRGIAPLRPELDRIASMTSKEDVIGEIIRLHRMGIMAVFTFGAQPDATDSTRMIATVGQGGLSLPDRDYYLKMDAKSVETRERFQQHVARMFVLAGDAAETAASKARAVMEVETILAKASADRVSMRDPHQRYHLMTKKELEALAPNFPCEEYFRGMSAPAFDTLNVSTPAFFQQISSSLPQDSCEPWKAYLEYHLLRATAAELAEPFEAESFDFWQRYLTGAKEPRPRAARCVAAV